MDYIVIQTNGEIRRVVNYHPDEPFRSNGK